MGSGMHYDNEWGKNGRIIIERALISPNSIKWIHTPLVIVSDIEHNPAMNWDQF